MSQNEANSIRELDGWARNDQQWQRASGLSQNEASSIRELQDWARTKPVVSESYRTEPECQWVQPSQINFVDLTPYLTYAGDIAWDGVRVGEVVLGASALDIARPEPYSVVNSTSAHDRQELHCVAETSVERRGGEGEGAKQCFQIAESSAAFLY
jgi:hypothetical protein